MKSHFFISSIGKFVGKASRLRGGHGSALPGLVVEKVAPNFLRDVIAKLPRGAVVISGTNGKTTTTKMVVELLRAAGLKVFTNDSGSNFARGVTSAAVREMRRGKLDADIAILELDEAHAVHFVREIPPRFCLLLNALRDQLDRFGEVDKIAGLLETVAKNTTEKVIINKNDSRLVSFAENLKTPVESFGFSEKLNELFPMDEESDSGRHCERDEAIRDDDKNGLPRQINLPRNDKAAVILERLDNSRATYKINDKNYAAELQLFGAYNALNGAAALALTRAILGEKFDVEKMVAALAQIKPAFGRGEIFHIDGREIRLILVKNPSGFRLSLASANASPTLIAINDTPADGCDVSWLNEVDFAVALRRKKIIFTSGVRARDVTQRLEQEKIKVTKTEPKVTTALNQFLTQTARQNAQIFANYSAMLEIRKLLKKRAN